MANLNNFLSAGLAFIIGGSFVYAMWNPINTWISYWFNTIPELYVMATIAFITIVFIIIAWSPIMHVISDDDGKA